MPRRPSLAAAAASLCAALTLGCGATDSTPSEPNPVASISLFPASALIEQGRSLRLSPTLRDARRLVVTGREVAWESSNPLVAAVTDGLVTGLREGIAIISASVDGSRGTASITVQRSVASVEISPEDPRVAVGSSVQLHATLKGGNGRPVEGPVIYWSTSDPSVATVDVGKVRGIRVGAAQITATAGDKSAVTSVTIVPNISGRWVLTTGSADSARGVTCATTESLTVEQTSGTFGGTLERSGSCTTANVTLDISGSFEPEETVLSTSQLNFLTGGQLGCTYDGSLSGTPASAAGEVFCSGDLGGNVVELRGTWEMRR